MAEGVKLDKVIIISLLAFTDVFLQESPVDQEKLLHYITEYYLVSISSDGKSVTESFLYISYSYLKHVRGY